MPTNNRCWRIGKTDSMEEIIEASRKLQVEAAVNAMKALTDSERLEVMRHFCQHCGIITEGQSCLCMRDE